MYSKRSLGSPAQGFLATGDDPVCAGSDPDKDTSRRQEHAGGHGLREDDRAAFRRPEVGERRMGPKMSVGTPPRGDAHAERATAAARRRLGDPAADPADRPHPDGPARRRRDEHAGPGLGRGPQRGLAVPLLPEQAGPPGVGADRAGVPPDQAGARRPRRREPRRRAPDAGAAPGRDHDLHVRGRGLRPPDGRRGDARRGRPPAPWAWTSSPRSSRASRTGSRSNRPDLDDGPGAAAVARLLSAMVVGIFIQHAADVLGEEGDDLTALSLDRAREAASILRPPG